MTTWLNVKSKEHVSTFYAISLSLKRLLSVNLLGDLVVLGSLFAGNKSSKSELLSGLLSSFQPSLKTLEVPLSCRQWLFRHNLSSLVQAQILLHKTSFGVHRGTTPDTSHGASLHLFEVCWFTFDAVGIFLHWPCKFDVCRWRWGWACEEQLWFLWSSKLQTLWIYLCWIWICWIWISPYFHQESKYLRWLHHLLWMIRFFSSVDII